MLTHIAQEQPTDFWGVVVPAWLTAGVALLALLIGYLTSLLTRHFDRRSKPIVMRRHGGDTWLVENRMRTPMVNIRYAFQDVQGQYTNVPGVNPSMLRGRAEMGISIPSGVTLTMNWDEIRWGDLKPARVAVRPRDGVDEYRLERRPPGVANG